MVQAAMYRAKVPKKPFEKPVKVVMYWNDGLDIDNHAYMGKMIVDSLKGWVIQDDSRRYLRSVTHEFHDGDYILVDISEVKHNADV